jgi:peptidoglycan/LPS O-acetylase OafA/YrhL
VPVGVLIMVAASYDLDGRRTFLQTRLWRSLGEVSFGFYLCQGVTIFYARMQLGDGSWGLPGALAVVVGLFVLTLCGGWALHALVEQPAMRRWARPRGRRLVR